MTGKEGKKAGKGRRGRRKGIYRLKKGKEEGNI
jgi:hypothetical protein